jgi:hypothetical protein
MQLELVDVTRMVDDDPLYWAGNDVVVPRPPRMRGEHLCSAGRARVSVPPYKARRLQREASAALATWSAVTRARLGLSTPATLC